MATILFWIHRVLSEKCSDMKKLSEEISVLNHQAENFNGMDETVKKEVVSELREHMKKYGWKHNEYLGVEK